MVNTHKRRQLQWLKFCINKLFNFYVGNLFVCVSAVIAHLDKTLFIPAWDCWGIFSKLTLLHFHPVPRASHTLFLAWQVSLPARPTPTRLNSPNGFKLFGRQCNSAEKGEGKNKDSVQERKQEIKIIEILLPKHIFRAIKSFKWNVAHSVSKAHLHSPHTWAYTHQPQH